MSKNKYTSSDVMANKPTFQDIILTLQQYWSEKGCIIMQPLDMEIGAATFHPTTFMRSIGPEPWHVAYVQPCRRPTDGRYGENPNRGQHYYQFQVILKPSPPDIQDLYLDSLRTLGVDFLANDIRFVEDNWESPTLGAWGLGWEVWLNSMEVSQFTYFQQMGGLECSPVTGELTYGLERIAMCLRNKNNMFDLIWANTPAGQVTYGDVFHQNEIEMSAYNFELANTEFLFKQFEMYAQTCPTLMPSNSDLGVSTLPNRPLPAYEMVLKLSHIFNLLDARHAISVTERQAYILRIRRLASKVAQAYYASREKAGFPLLKEKNDVGNT